MEYIKIICTGGSKMADASNHDITVMDIHVLYIVYNQLPWFYQRPYYLVFFALCLLWGKYGFCQYIQ